ncbi:MAG: hypothetical protein DRR19_06915 [Candidatus Parabeggiatoa sp. nov. 1]|nr:MAG: hypothetical protein DRR19_06915 [Gammaproteobacteria bacterium]
MYQKTWFLILNSFQANLVPKNLVLFKGVQGEPCTKNNYNYLAPLVRIIIAWGNAPGAGVYDLKPFLPIKGLFVVILAKQFIPSYHSLVSASSRLGIDGEVMISSPEEDISGRFFNLTTDFFDASALLKKKCHIQYVNELSRFRIRTQREGMPMTPASFQE